MKYQLVLQWPCFSEAYYDRLMDPEAAIEAGLGEAGVVDGHDCGSFETNILIHADEPGAALARALSLIRGHGSLDHLAAGCRLFGGEDYIAIFPGGSKSFSVL